MRIKVYVVDLELSARAKRWLVGLAAFALLAVGAALPTF